MLQVTVSKQVAQTIRLRAAMDGVTPGRVIEAAIIETNVRQGVVEELTHGARSEDAPRKTSARAPKAKEPKKAKGTGRKVAAASAVPVGPEWTEAKLKKAMEQGGLSGRALAEQLESRNGTPPQGVQVNRWSRGAEKIPMHYWGQLERIFGGGK